MADQVTQNIENVSYYGLYGGQPFWHAGDTKSSTYTGIINFNGTNSFIVPGKARYAQEFAEFQGSMKFKSKSNTKIVQKSRTGTGSSEAFIWNRRDLTITVESDAKVDIESGKNNLFYSYNSPDIKINLQDNSIFKFKNDSTFSYKDAAGNTISGDTGQTNNTLTEISLNSIEFNINDSAQMVFESTNKALNIKLKPLTVNSTNIELLKFVNTNATKTAALSGNTLNLNSKSSNDNYLLDLTGIADSNSNSNFIAPVKDNTGQPSFTSVKPKSNANFDSNELSKYSAIIYSIAPSFSEVSAIGCSDMDATDYYSKIASSLTDVKGSDIEYLFKPQYYITSDQTVLADNDVTKLYTDSTNSYSTDYKTGSITYANFSTIDKIQQPLDLDHLMSNNYRIYGRLAVQSLTTKK